MNNKICVITGGTGGIGHTLCKSFLNEGYTVVALDNQMRNQLPPEVDFMEVNLRYSDEIVRAFQIIREKYKTVHVLINNAGIAQFQKPIGEVRIHELDEILDVNLRGAFLCSKEFIEINNGQTYGRIINISSTRFHQNMPNWEIYGLTKGGLVSLTNSLCVSLAKTPITVNAISPGWIETVDYRSLSQADHVQHPSGRVGKPIDIANACLFLCADENDFINGNNMIIDGGMTKVMIYEE